MIDPTPIPSRNDERAVPENWGRDSLTRFFANMEAQSLATFANQGALLKPLQIIDGILEDKLETLFHGIGKRNYGAAKLFGRMFSAYRAAARLAVAGQVFESTVLCRTVLECGVYGWAYVFDDETASAWDKRDDSDDDRKQARKALMWGRLMGLVEARHAVDVVADIRSEYERLVDMGAHPNRQGVELSLDVVEIDEARDRVSTITSHGTAEAYVFALVGVCKAIDYGSDLLVRAFHVRAGLIGLDRQVGSWKNDVHEALAAASKAMGKPDSREESGTVCK